MKKIKERIEILTKEYMTQEFNPDYDKLDEFDKAYFDFCAQVLQLSRGHPRKFSTIKARRVVFDPVFREKAKKIGIKC